MLLELRKTAGLHEIDECVDCCPGDSEQKLYREMKQRVLAASHLSRQQGAENVVVEGEYGIAEAFALGERAWLRVIDSHIKEVERHRGFDVLGIDDNEFAVK